MSSEDMPWNKPGWVKKKQKANGNNRASRVFRARIFSFTPQAMKHPGRQCYYSATFYIDRLIK